MNYVMACKSLDQDGHPFDCVYMPIESLVTPLYHEVIIGSTEHASQTFVAVLLLYVVGMAVGIIISQIKKLR